MSWRARTPDKLVVGQRVMTPDNRMRTVRRIEPAIPLVLGETRVFWGDGGEEQFCNNRQLLAEVREEK